LRFLDGFRISNKQNCSRSSRFALLVSSSIRDSMGVTEEIRSGKKLTELEVMNSNLPLRAFVKGGEGGEPRQIGERLGLCLVNCKRRYPSCALSRALSVIREIFFSRLDEDKDRKRRGFGHTPFFNLRRDLRKRNSERKKSQLYVRIFVRYKIYDSAETLSPIQPHASGSLQNRQATLPEAL